MDGFGISSHKRREKNCSPGVQLPMWATLKSSLTSENAPSPLATRSATSASDPSRRSRFCRSLAWLNDCIGAETAKLRLRPATDRNRCKAVLRPVRKTGSRGAAIGPARTCRSRPEGAVAITSAGSGDFTGPGAESSIWDVRGSGSTRHGVLAQCTKRPPPFPPCSLRARARGDARPAMICLPVGPNAGPRMRLSSSCVCRPSPEFSLSNQRVRFFQDGAQG